MRIQFDYVRFPDVKPSVESRLDYKNAWSESKPWQSIVICGLPGLSWSPKVLN